jgi:hypothetical protein
MDVTQHPNLSKEDVHDVMKGIYDEAYSGSNSIVLHYQDLIRNQVPRSSSHGDASGKSTQGVPEAFMVLKRVRSEKGIETYFREKGVH